MKKLQSFFAHLQWRLILFFFGTATILLFYQTLFWWMNLTIPGDLSMTDTLLPSVRLPFYLERACSFSILICLCIFLYNRPYKSRIKHMISTLQRWRNDNFSHIVVQDNEKDEIGHLNRQLNDMVQELQRSVKKQKEMIRLNERNILARELHDTVKQQLFALAFQISIARKIHSAENDQLDMHLLEAKNILKDIQVELTKLIFSMHQDALEEQDLTDVLAIYLSRWSSQYGISIKLTKEIQGHEKSYFLSAHIKNTFFRVTQEALSNVARHSGASFLHITLTINWLYIILKIVDNGQGFNYAQQKEDRMGISFMQERMKEIGGSLSIKSQLHSGTEVIATYRLMGTRPDTVSS